MQTQPPRQRVLRFSDLSVPRQMLVRLCQGINYGALQGLQIQEREPAFDPPPIVLTDVKLDVDRIARPEIDLPDFVLRDEIVRLMEHLDGLVNTTVEHLEVHAGVPRRLTFRFPLAAPLKHDDGTID
jgi:hypothetical protein